MSVISPSKAFIPGTTGWTADDLLDPEIERRWFEGRYEIVEGVLTKMPPAYMPSGKALFNLLHLLRLHIKERSIPADIATEVDLVLGKRRVVVADAAVMTPDDDARQSELAKAAPKPKHGQVRILVPPTLVVESISIEHEAHDREIKRRWYAEAGVPNYWLLNAYEKTLECLVLKGGEYQLDAAGRDSDEVRPSAFPDFVIPLAEVWG